jgi:hypothetical protein
MSDRNKRLRQAAADDQAKVRRAASEQEETTMLALLMGAVKKLGQGDLNHYMMQEVVDEMKSKLKEKGQQFSATLWDIKNLKDKDLTCTLGMNMYHDIVLSSSYLKLAHPAW